jgi:hypothetical protein
MNKQLLGIAALILAIGIGTALIIGASKTDSSRQPATAVLAPTTNPTPISGLGAGDGSYCTTYITTVTGNTLAGSSGRCDTYAQTSCYTPTATGGLSVTSGPSYLISSTPKQKGKMGEFCISVQETSGPNQPGRAVIDPLTMKVYRDIDIDRTLTLSGFPKKLTDAEVVKLGLPSAADIKSYLQTNKLLITSLIPPKIE